jgi:hypothetical protein
MDCLAILDTSCIIWDTNDYDNNTFEYLILKTKMVNLFDTFTQENTHILLRDELISEMLISFPYDRINEHPHDYNHRVATFVMNIPANRRHSCQAQNNNITSTPVITKAHFSANTRLEVSYILSRIHSNPTDLNCYFAYPYLFNHPGPLTTTQPGVLKGQNCTTVFFDDELVLDAYFAQFRKVFEHNPLHHQQNKQNSKKSKLRCYNGRDINVPQDYLNRSIFANNRYYFFDPVNQVYVIFFRHQANRFHGHEEENINLIPNSVRQHFNV